MLGSRLRGERIRAGIGAAGLIHFSGGLQMADATKRLSDSETGCCKRFDPAPWDGKTVVFKDRLFLKDHVPTFFHIPMGFGKAMVKNMSRIQEAGALGEQLMLCDDCSLFGMDMYIAVSKDVPGARMQKISGTFLSKVFEGPFKDTGKWMKEMNAYVASKGKSAKKMYTFYTTCPSCAKYYGHNYVVLLAQI